MRFRMLILSLFSCCWLQSAIVRNSVSSNLVAKWNSILMFSVIAKVCFLWLKPSFFKCRSSNLKFSLPSKTKRVFISSQMLSVYISYKHSHKNVIEIKNFPNSVDFVYVLWTLCRFAWPAIDPWGELPFNSSPNICHNGFYSINSSRVHHSFFLEDKTYLLLMTTTVAPIIIAAIFSHNLNDF